MREKFSECAIRWRVTYNPNDTLILRQVPLLHRLGTPPFTYCCEYVYSCEHSLLLYDT